MSAYYDDDRRRPSTKSRRDDYYDDEVYTNTRDNQRSTTTALVRRRNDSPDSVEEVRRDFSPGDGGYYRETITRRSGVRPAGRARSYEEDDSRSYASTRRDDYKRSSRQEDDRRSRASRGAGRRDNYSDSSSSRSRTPPKKRERRKSMPEEALEALGLGGLLASITGKKNRSRSSSRDRRSRSRGGGNRSRSRSQTREQLTQALKAAVLAGAGAAFAARHEEGGWQGEKGKRILTAAVTAGGASGLLNQYKDPEKHKLRDTIGSAAAGLAADRLVNGPAIQSRGASPDSRRGGRSRSRSRVGDIAAGGTLAAAAKKITDGFRSRSQSRGRDSRSPSYDDYRDRSPPRRKSRSRSVVASGLSKIGLGSAADKVDPAGARERSRSRGPARRRSSRSRSRSRYADDDYYDDDYRRGSSQYEDPRRASSMYGDNRDVGPQSSRTRSLSRTRSVGGGQLVPRPHDVGPGGQRIAQPPSDYTLDYKPRHTGDPETDSDSDLGSSSEDEQEHKKGRKGMLVSGGLATVATIHAGKSIYGTLEKREARKRAVREGLMSREEAEKHKMRDRLQDAASVGLAGLGVKGAYGEWKEMKEKQEEWKETKEKVLRHRRKREARRQKARMVGMNEGYSTSAPTLSDPFYADGGHDNNGRQHVYHGSQGPYMSGGAGLAPRHNGSGGPSPMGNGTQTQYFDGNPYASVSGQSGYQYQDQGRPQQQGYGQRQGQGQDYGYGYRGNGYDNGASNVNYPPPPPQQGGTGYPPPPMGGPSPMGGGR